jgi:hypothetical protein
VRRHRLGLRIEALSLKGASLPLKRTLTLRRRPWRGVDGLMEPAGLRVCDQRAVIDLLSGGKVSEIAEKGEDKLGNFGPGGTVSAAIKVRGPAGRDAHVTDRPEGGRLVSWQCPE